MISVFRLILATLLITLTAGCSVVAGSASPSQPPRAVSHAQPVHRKILGRSDPEFIAIPRISARSSLIPLGLNQDGTVQVPPVETPMQAGWYKLGASPGEPGRAVILGHVDGRKDAGIFYRLRELRPGDEIVVRRQDQITVRFQVRELRQVDKSTFPADEVYGDSPVPELRVVTCGGSFDRATQNYRDNIIVFATAK